MDNNYLTAGECDQILEILNGRMFIANTHFSINLREKDPFIEITPIDGKYLSMSHSVFNGFNTTRILQDYVSCRILAVSEHSMTDFIENGGKTHHNFYKQ